MVMSVIEWCRMRDFGVCRRELLFVNFNKYFDSKFKGKIKRNSKYDFKNDEMDYTLSINSLTPGGSGANPFLFLISATAGPSKDFGTSVHSLNDVFQVARPAV